MNKTLNLIFSSVKFYRKPVFYQVLIITLLSAVITGSILVGSSVKQSLRQLASVHLGNTGILISSGNRYISSDIAGKLNTTSAIKCAGVVELNGFSQNLVTQKSALNVKIYGINENFFPFQGFNQLKVNAGEVLVNSKLAQFLGVKTGDEIIVRFTGISSIPSDAPFAPSAEATSKVLKVGNIISDEDGGNFSLAVSQLTPMNIFMNNDDIKENSSDQFKLNRILIDGSIKSTRQVISSLSQILMPSDLGLNVRYIKKSGNYELTSDRIFFDEIMLKQVTDLIDGSAPVLTYLANRITFRDNSTPYSFVSALPSSIYPQVVRDSEIIINKWMADDLSARENDTIKMYWYSPDSLNKLVEKSGNFIIKQIVEMKGIWADSLLMPDFPGISGKESCSDWDAGVPVNMHDIRPKDEEYWKRYRGTPKAFISYDKGKEIWGNNFGSATAIRFREGTQEQDIINKFKGGIDPEKSGLIITDLAGESISAANESVDFSSLFLSLGFFLILAAMVLLSFAASAYFDAGKQHVKTLFAIGFTRKWIIKLLLLETGVISLAGCLAGSFGGYFVNVIITSALNTVWQGAVQTNTLKAFFSLSSIIAGFALSFLAIMIMMIVKVRRFIAVLNRKKNDIRQHSSGSNQIPLITAILITIIAFILSLTTKEILWSYAGGTMLMISMLLALRLYFLRKKTFGNSNFQLSGMYYSTNPTAALAPVLFIAAGIFTVFVTGANRMNFSDKTSRSGGTGGYLLWCENSIPVKEDPSTASGKRSLGLDDDQLDKITFVLIKRAPGNDASCLNLNHIKVPPLLGVDAGDFIRSGSFSFSSAIKSGITDPWQYLEKTSDRNIIYGVADQTVLDWGLKVKTGDTLVIRTENGIPLKIIIAGGLKSSVFQGNVLIGKENFSKYYPSVNGSSIFLVDGERKSIDLYKSVLEDRLEGYGVNVEKTTDRLASFYQVTNTYLSVFSLFGALGMITGIIGLGFVLIKNYNQRKQEFALMLALGFRVKKIRRIILSGQVLIIVAGIFAGIVSAIAATLPALKSNAGFPWLQMSLMTVAILVTGMAALLISIRTVTNRSLIESLRKE